MSDVDALNHVASCYCDYASEVNGHRSIPSSRDGLKRVQRRLLSTFLLKERSNDEIASSSIIGSTIKYYHPHGESSIYGAMVKMINDHQPVLEGHGNFGQRLFSMTLGPAAPRYTKAKINELGRSCYGELIGFTDHYTNENDEKEPIFIPTSYPYALINGALGIGIGCATNIPAFEIEDIKEVLKQLLSGKKPEDCTPMRPSSPGGGKIEIDEANLRSLNLEGRGTGYACAEVYWFQDAVSQQTALRITNVPDYVNLQKLTFILRDEVNEGLIFIRDESQEKITVVVGRNKYIKRISDAELEKKVRWVARRRISWNCTFSHDGVAQTMSPIRVLESSLNSAIECNNKWMKYEKEKLEEEIIFEKIKKPLSELLARGDSDDLIIRKLSITREQFKSFIQRSLSRLRSEKKDTEEIKEKVRNLEEYIRTPKRAYRQRIGLL
jgi:DNA gyrase subunit A